MAIRRRPAGATTPTLVAAVDGRDLVADVEGVALAGTSCLVVSSPGDNAYVLYDLATERFARRFRVGAGAGAFGATSETDGIAVALGDFGLAYSDGLFVAQDGDNEPAAQNFKLVPLASIAAALSLEQRR